MTTSTLNRLAVTFGAAGLLAAILTTTMPPALGASASAQSNHHASGARPATSQAPALRYIEGTDVSVPAGSIGQNAAKCPRGMYPVGGGPSSPTASWTLQWSNPDRSARSASHPNEWTVSLYNYSTNTEVFKVFVVCSTAQKVTSNY